MTLNNKPNSNILIETDWITHVACAQVHFGSQTVTETKFYCSRQLFH